MREIELGLGLLSIGRTWGVGNVPPPSREDSLALLSLAVERGIRFFDTAPAYGASEGLLGAFLSASPGLRDGLTIATKMGEVWDDAFDGTNVDHSYDQLVESVERSLARLGRIDLLQVHKADAENILSDGVVRAIDFAERQGIKAFGASVSDLETARLACASGRYRTIQFPFNRENTDLQPAFAMARAHNVRVIVNRPLAMGKLAADRNRPAAIAEAYGFILEQQFEGRILTGTSSGQHLTENLSAFCAACA